MVCNDKTTTYPYNDNTMTYDYTMHKYVLQPNYVKKELGIDWETLNNNGDANPSTLGIRLLKQVSNTVYNYIYKDRDKERLEYEMATVYSLRDMIREMLLSQCLYFFTNGLLQNYSGVNIVKGSAMDIRLIRGRAKVSDDVEILANTNVRELGRSLMYIGYLPLAPCNQGGW